LRVELHASRRGRADGGDDLHPSLGAFGEALLEPGLAQLLADLRGQLDGSLEGFFLLVGVDLADGQHGLGDLPRMLEVDRLLSLA